jgi:hypothetical protein
MSRLAPIILILIVAGFGFLADIASAQTVEELKRELEVKNAEIARLKRRVQQLEAGGAPSAHPMAQPTYAPPPGPGEEEIDRALEQTLVSQGALVLAPFTYELTPEFSWAHWDTVTNPTLENSYSAGLGFRMGMPWRSQISVAVPYIWNDFGKGGTSDGLGDAGVLFSKELISEGNSFPALLGSVGWTSPTSRACCAGPIPYVSGFQGGLTAVKRLDPLVAFAGVSYYSEISGDVAGTIYDPSDVIGTRLGASLAVTPATSVTAGINISFLTDTQPGNLLGPKPDDVLASVDLGFNTLLWRHTFLNVTGQFGLTGDIPDFRLITSVPVRF